MRDRETAACPFCGISNGTEPSSDVVRDERVVAFLANAPVNPGHVLVVPRGHARNLSDLEDDAAAAVFLTAVRVQAAVRASGLRCEGINLFLADGEAASQLVAHVHLHVIPRFAGDGFRLNPKGGVTTCESMPAREELDAAAAAVRDAYLRIWGD